MVNYRSKELVLKENYKDIKQRDEYTNPQSLSGGSMVFSACHHYENEKGEVLMTDRANFTLSESAGVPTVTIAQKYQALGDFQENGGSVTITEKQLQWLCKQLKGSNCC